MLLPIICVAEFAMRDTLNASVTIRVNADATTEVAIAHIQRYAEAAPIYESLAYHTSKEFQVTDEQVLVILARQAGFIVASAVLQVSTDCYEETRHLLIPVALSQVDFEQIEKTETAPLSEPLRQHSEINAAVVAVGDLVLALQARAKDEECEVAR